MLRNMDGSGLELVKISAGIIVQAGRVLLCQRREGEGVAGLWEFPGGKREPGETAAECLRRECLEELDVCLRVGPVFARLDWPAGQGRLCFTFLWAQIERGAPRCLVHKAIRWVSPKAIPRYALCPADASIADRVAATFITQTNPTEE